MRPVAFGEALSAGTRLTLFSDDKPTASLPSLSSGWMQPSGVALELKTSVPSYQVEDEEGRIHLLIHYQLRNSMKTAGVSGGMITQALTQDRSLRVR